MGEGELQSAFSQFGPLMEVRGVVAVWGIGRTTME